MQTCVVRHTLKHESLLHDITERRMSRKRMHLLNDLMRGKYLALKRTVEDRKKGQKLKKNWKSYTCFSADYLMKKKLL